LAGRASISLIGRTVAVLAFVSSAAFADIQNVRQKALTLYKVEATLTFFIGDDRDEGNNYPALQAAIDKQLKWAPSFAFFGSCGTPSRVSKIT
jgi:hypothetical protein